MEKLVDLYSNVTSWVCTALIFLGTFLGDASEWVLYIFLISLLDLVMAFIKSRKLGYKVVSSRIFNYLGKVALYISILLGFQLLDRVIGLDGLWFTRIYSSIILFSEVWSILAHAIIIMPNIPVFKFLRSFLRDEIASKLNLDKNELEEYFKTDSHEDDKHTD